MEWGELEVSGPSEAWRTTVIAARIDPSRVALRLEARIADGGATAAWTVDSAADALLAVNAGQFAGARPWGWVVHGGREASAPAYGPLSSALVVDASGAAHLLDFAEIAAARAADADGTVVEAVQSYPALLVGDGEVPAALRMDRGAPEPAARIDRTHRDGRLALGILRDGRLLLVLTRFGALGGAASTAPLGLTVPELAAVMGALGSRRAVALDGGLSSQLLIRDGRTTRAWRGWRRVPIGLVVRGR
jgi:exopolysaccharide biosynthesis protein